VKTKNLRGSIIKKTAIALVVLAVAFAAFACGNVGSVESMNKTYASSIEKVKTVTATVAYKDGKNTVYSSETVYAFSSDSSAEVTEKVTAIDTATFENKETVTTETRNVKKTDMVAVKLESRLINSGYKLADGELTGEVSGAENVKEFIGGDLPVFGAVTFTVKFESGKISLVKYSFVTETQKNAEVTYVYAY